MDINTRSDKLLAWFDKLLLGKEIPRGTTVGDLPDFPGKQCTLNLQKLGVRLMGGTVHYNTPASDPQLLALIDLLVRKGVLKDEDFNA